MSHKKQGTGSWAGNRDKHQNKQTNKAKERNDWVDMGKKTNSERNRKKDIGEEIIRALLGGKNR